jgi:hypothetical protein
MDSQAIFLAPLLLLPGRELRRSDVRARPGAADW